MRTIKGQNLPGEINDSLFPDGQVRNETPTQQGTPVVREIYGDVLTNIYKIIRDSGVAINEQEDNEISGYQFLKALKVFTNDLNDLQQIITVGSASLQVSFDADNLPDGYVFIGKLSDSIVKGEAYNFTSLGNNSFSFNAGSDIPASTIAIVTVKSSTIEVIPVINQENQNGFLITPFSGVLSHNNTNTTYYLSDGYLINNTPISINIQQSIRLFESDATIFVSDAVIHKNKLLVMAKSVDVNVYDFYLFDLTNLSSVEQKMTYTQSGAADYAPYLYANKDFIYLSNNGNNSTSDNLIDKIELNLDLTPVLNKVSEITLDASFQKTSNAFVKNDEIYTFVNGNLNLYKSDGSIEFKLFLNNINGQLFVQNEIVYFTSGEIANPWNI